MKQSILTQAASPDSLNKAWQRVKNDSAPWQRDISRKTFTKDFVFHITSLAKNLESGDYQPDPVTFFPLSTLSGKKRLISVSTLRDKMAQRAVLTVIEPMAESFFHGNSYGYRPGRSVAMAQSRAKEYLLGDYTWIVKADIEHCFDSIGHRELLTLLRKLFKDPMLIRLFSRWLKSGVLSKGLFAKAEGIPQGSVLSPLFCNVYLTPLDNRLSKKNIPFVRYADDLVLFARTRSEAEKTVRCLEGQLKKIKLKINTKKAVIASAEKGTVFLGKKLGGSSRVSNYKHKPFRKKTVAARRVSFEKKFW